MAPILTNDTILNASKYSQLNLFKNAEALMDRKEEIVKKMEFFEYFDLFFGFFISKKI